MSYSSYRERIESYSPFSSKYDADIENAYNLYKQGNPYQKQIESYQDKLANFDNQNANYKEALSLSDKLKKQTYFDPSTDKTYQQYAKSYVDNGKRAYDDTLARAAARTGGLAGSYAVTAAQQSYNNYMKQLADKVPELEQLARGRVTEDYNRIMGISDKERSSLAALRDSYSQMGKDRLADYYGAMTSGQSLRTDEYNQKWLSEYNKLKELADMAYKEEQLELQREQIAAQQAAAAARRSSGGRSYDDDDDDDWGEYNRTTASYNQRQYGLSESELLQAVAEGWFRRTRRSDGGGLNGYDYSPVDRYDSRGFKLNNPYLS